MLVSEVMDYAVKGGLTQLGISDVGPFDEVPSAKQQKNRDTIISYIKLAVLEIYKRFDIRTDKIVFNYNPYLMSYTIPATGTSVLGVYLPDGTEVPLNEEDCDEFCAFTPNPFTVNLQNAPPEGLASFVVVFGSFGNPITVMEDYIDLPLTYLTAILDYISYQGRDPTTPNGGGTVFYQRFLQACAEIKTNGLVTADGSSNNKLNYRGFA